MWQKKSNNKFGAIKQTFNGHVYDSRLEASHARALEILKRAKKIKDYERQYKIDLYFYDSKGKRHPYKSWKVDFRVELKDKKYELHEVKGFETDDFRWKKAICEKVWLVDNPQYSLVVLYAKDINTRL